MEEWIHTHPEFLKYPFSEADTETLYRFSISPQVTRMLGDMRRTLDQELIVQARACVGMEKREFLQLLPNDPKGRELVRRRIVTVGDGKRVNVRNRSAKSDCMGRMKQFLKGIWNGWIPHSVFVKKKNQKVTNPPREKITLA